MAWVGEEGGQAGVVGVRAGEEGLSLFSWRQQARLRGEAGQRIRGDQSWRNPVGVI